MSFMDFARVLVTVVAGVMVLVTVPVTVVVTVIVVVSGSLSLLSSFLLATAALAIPLSPRSDVCVNSFAGVNSYFLHTFQEYACMSSLILALRS